MKMLVRATLVYWAVFVIGVAAALGALVLMHKTPEEMAQKLLDKRPPKIYKWFYQNPFEVAGVGADEYERCLEWAFGEDIVSVVDRLWPARWNERHSDIFTMYGSDPVQVSLIAVGKAYLNRPRAITIEGGADISITDCNFVEEPWISAEETLEEAVSSCREPKPDRLIEAVEFDPNRINFIEL